MVSAMMASFCVIVVAAVGIWGIIHVDQCWYKEILMRGLAEYDQKTKKLVWKSDRKEVG